MKTYTGILNKIHYKQPRKIIVAYGSRFEFVDGRLSGIPEYAATMLLKRKILQAIIPEFEEAPVVVNDVATEQYQPETYETFMDVTTTVEAPVPVEDLYQAPVVTDVAPDVIAYEVTAHQEDTTVTEPEETTTSEISIETEDGTLTRSELESFYNELGTWTAVAATLNISTSTLKKYRESLGL